MLLICDSYKPLAIAGVMGGANSEVDETAHKIVIESAYFDPISIRRTSKQLGLQTAASKRFEKGTDPNQLLFVLDKAAEMIQKLAGGEIEKDRIDIKTKEFTDSHVSCRLSRINQLLGVSLSRGEIESFFQNLTFPCHWDGQDKFTVQVPTFRNDIKGEVDLIEEVARLYGYENIPRKSSGFLSSTLPHAPLYLLEKTIRQKMIEEGLQEFLTCDLIGPTISDIIKEKNMPAGMIVHVLNPTSIEQSILRTTLLPGLLQVLKYNIDHDNLNIGGFEIGRIHWKNGENYEEQSVTGIILSGRASSPSWNQMVRDYDFYDLKGIIENLLESLGIEKAEYKNLKLNTFHSGRQASFFVKGIELGSIGEIHPAIQRRLGVTQRILFGEFNLENLIQVMQKTNQLKSLPLYPSSTRDWTLTVKRSLPFDLLSQAIRKNASSLLEEFSLKDIYLSEKIGEEYQNLTLNFIYRDLSKTIQNEIVDQEQERLVLAVIEEIRDAIKN